ncbi:MAG: hypothetical protein ACM3PB_00900 [Betaproteobacteria bacterium]
MKPPTTARTTIDKRLRHCLFKKRLAVVVGDNKYSCVDISLAKTVLGYQPKVSLKNGLWEIVDSKRK